MIMKYASIGEYKNVYRPRDIKYVVGHDTIKKFLINSINNNMLPHILMFYGQKGVGKTTIARIIAAGLNCETTQNDYKKWLKTLSGQKRSYPLVPKAPEAVKEKIVKGTLKTQSDKFKPPMEKTQISTKSPMSLSPCGICDNCRSIFSGSSPDYKEVNVADKTGVDNIRALIETFKLSPMYLTNKVYVLDECHALSKQGQNAILKALEDTPESVYIIFCTTSMENLLPTLLERCYDFHFEKLTEEELGGMLRDILTIEGQNLNKDIANALIELADGSARGLVVNLQKILLADIKNIKDAAGLLGTEIVQQHDIKHLFKAIMSGSSKDSFDIINKYSYVDCDLARKGLINYFGAILLRAGKTNYKEATRISYIIDVLSSNISNPTKGMFVNDIFKATTYLK